MEGYKIYNYQRESLIKQTMIDGTKYNPVKNINGDWFIFEQEYKHCKIGELTEFVAPIQEEII